MKEKSMNPKKVAQRSNKPAEERAREVPGQVFNELTTTTVSKTVKAEKKVWFIPADNILHILRHEIMEKTGCNIDDQGVSIMVRNEIDWRDEEFEGFTVEVVKAIE